MYEPDYNLCFSNLDLITGLPIKLKGNRWVGACRIDGSVHHRQDKLVAIKSREDGIILIEQGNTPMSLWRWLESYGGCKSKVEIVSRIKMDKIVEKRQYIPEQVKELRFVDSRVMNESLNLIGIVEDALFEFLINLFPRKDVIEAYKLYNVTPYLKKGVSIVGTNFWVVRQDGVICHDKVMFYDCNTGKRKKDISPYRQFKQKNGYRAINLFGSHLLSKYSKGDTIYLVESEKTALLIYLYFGIPAVATAGSGCTKLIDDRFIVLPDYDKDGQKWVERFPDRCKLWWDDFPDLVEVGNDIGDIIVKRLYS